ncbi:MAG: transketolase [Armatimonadetes bacterium]|nr:transketolase [Armatimonadota bacterium]
MSELDDLCVNTIRFLAVDAVQRAESGHPGMPMGAAPMAWVLWDRFLEHNPADPDWPDRDRFILSAGHGSTLLYALLHLTGYDLPLEQLKQFRQWGSLTPGHPEHGLTPGVETTTGPLGQGFGNGVGMAIAEAFLAATFGEELVNHYTYAIVSDGDLMEGVASEAASLVGHLRLGKLIYLYDDNRISIEGPTDLAFTEDVTGRFEAYGWQVLEVEDGNDLDAIEAAIRQAQAESERPSLIRVHTHIGWGSPKQDTASAHGEPLGEENIAATKQKLGWPLEPTFYVPDEVAAHMREALARGKQAQAQWRERVDSAREEAPERVDLFERLMAGELPAGWQDVVPTFFGGDAPAATRSASGAVINAMAKALPTLIGGSADLAPSTKTLMDDVAAFGPDDFGGRNLHFGVREHAMGAIVNGMALHGGVIPYGATFLVFSDYMRGAVRLSALMGCRCIWVFTHDSIGVGEDGPTHQPVEQVMSLRAIPGLRVFRPADANETAVAWLTALEYDGPTALALTRQKLPILDPGKYPVANAERGGYVLSEAEGDPDLVIIATGSEVSLALEAQEALRGRGIAARVVSMPCWEIFREQPEEYRASVLPPNAPRLAIEAGVTMGWREWVGDAGEVIGLDRFGASAPGPVVMEKFGFTVDNIVERALALPGVQPHQPEVT